MSEHDDETMAPDRAVTEPEAREIDVGVRALRDAPVDVDRMARMRAGLDAKIDALGDDFRDGTGDAPRDGTGDALGDVPGGVVRLEAHRHWRRFGLAAVAALAAAALLMLWGPRLWPSNDVTPPLELVRDLAPIDPGDASHPDDVAPEGSVADASVTNARGDLDPLLDAASDEEVAVILEYESLADFDVIDQLDLLELLDALDGERRI